MTYDLLLEVPAGLDLDGQPEPVLAMVADYQPQWPPGGILPGSLPVNGRQLINVIVQADDPDPLTRIEADLAAAGVDWVVVGLQTPEGEALRPVAREVVAPYIDPDSIGIYAGHAPWVVVE